MKRRTSLEIQVDADVRAASAGLHALEVRLDAFGERLDRLRAEIAAATFIDCNARPPRRPPSARVQAHRPPAPFWRAGAGTRWHPHPSH